MYNRYMPGIFKRFHLFLFLLALAMPLYANPESSSSVNWLQEFLKSLLQAGVLITILGMVGGFIFWAGGFWDKFKGMATGIKEIKHSLSNVQEGINLLVVAMSRQRLLDAATLEKVSGLMIRRVEASINPINQDEADKINHYLEMASAKQSFTTLQAEEFLALAKKYKDDIKDPQFFDLAAKVMTWASYVYGMFGKPKPTA